MKPRTMESPFSAFFCIWLNEWLVAAAEPMIVQRERNFQEDLKTGGIFFLPLLSHGTPSLLVSLFSLLLQFHTQPHGLAGWLFSFLKQNQILGVSLARCEGRLCLRR